MNSRSASKLLVPGVVATLAVAAAAAHADDTGSRFGIVLFGGGNAAMPGSFRGQTVPYDSIDPAGSIVYHDLKFADAYNDRYTLGTEFDYAVMPNLSAYGRFAYQNFNGQNVHVGEFTGTDFNMQPVLAQFQDTNTQEYDIGARYNFGMMGAVQPFFGLALGAEHLGATRADFQNVSGTGTTNVVLGQADTVFHQRLETGLQFSPADKFDLRLSVAANHVDADTKSNDPNLALVGLDNTMADVRSHWEYPVEFGGVWKF
jgi:Outer membrane protein beta-barrel domain